MSKYDFDGVDIDWEYPVDEDRGGVEADFDALPKFLANVKSALRGTGGRDGLTITLPASYWYLQHFDVKSLAKEVEFFNIMSYDLHGTWDIGNKWTGAFLNAHSNLTEIELALDLLWRNDIDPDQVVLGLAFYGRAFTVTSASCTTPGCTYESGANAGPCSNEVSILLNVEIKNIVEERGLTPKLYEQEAVKFITWDNQWVGFDDEDTLKMKCDFARSQCLGGVMVWAVSHDTKDAQYSRALAELTGRVPRIALGQTLEGDLTEEVVNTRDQCKWTNCGENCPNGWQWVLRTDKDKKRDDERMTDDEGCDKTGIHKLCCPPSSKQPSCGWYTHHNGKCDSTCPSGMVEVGSNSIYCNKGYQAACCTTDTDSTTLYDNCAWGSSPNCDRGSCTGAKSTEIALSTSGSGGAICSPRTYTDVLGQFGPNDEYQQRKYCCDQSEERQTWDDCVWYDNYGFIPAGSANSFCASGCPPHLTRVAMDKDGGQCRKKGGARAKCCSVGFKTITKRSSELKDEYEEAFFGWTSSGSCTVPRVLDLEAEENVKRSLFYRNVSDATRERALSLIPRAISNEFQFDMVVDLLVSALTGRSTEYRTLWDDLLEGKPSMHRGR